MMNRMHVFAPQRSWYRAAAAGVAVFAATTVAPSSLAAQALVKGVRVESSQAGTYVAVSLTDSVARSAFTLAGPNRIVLDLPGATLGAIGGRAYDGQPRGPVQNIRMAQYRADIVRVVIDVEGPARYTVSGGNEVRVVLAGGTETAAWSTGEAMPATRVASAEPRETAVAVMDSSVSSGRVQAGDAPSQIQYQTPVQATIGTAAATAGKPPKPRITVSYQEADIRDVIAAFASFANRTIVVGKDVAGSITADVKDKPWDEALAAILTAQGLAASEEPNGIIIVDSYRNMLDKQSLEPLVTQVVSINYANASSVAGTVRGLLTRDCVPGANGPGSGGGGGGGAPGTGADRLCGARQRAGRQRHELAAHPRGAEPHGGRHQLRPLHRPPHAAGRDQGEDHLRQPQQPAGNRHHLRHRHGAPVLQHRDPAPGSGAADPGGQQR